MLPELLNRRWLAQRAGYISVLVLLVLLGLYCTSTLSSKYEERSHSKHPLSGIHQSMENQSEGEPTEKRCRQVMSEPLHLVETTNYRIQLIAGAPGSGNDWCILTIQLFTGLLCSATVPQNHRASSMETLQHFFYLKTHHPHLQSQIPFQIHLDTHPARVVLTIRNPLDAGFSDYIRINTVKTWTKKARRKYQNVADLFTESNFIQTSHSPEGQRQIASGLENHLKLYFKKWKYHHKYWLTEYTGPLKVVLYKDLVNDISQFKDIIEFFGYNIDSVESRRERFRCVLNNSSMTRVWKRKTVSVIESSKEEVRKLYQSETKEATSFVEQIYRDKFVEDLTIT